MMLPRWIPFAIAFWVIAFGILRLRIATRKELPGDEDRPNFRKGGYYARSKRSHAIYGVAYLALGAYCIAMGFGYQINFISSCMGNRSAQEAPAVKGGVPATVVKPSASPEATE
tara:strand:- start:17873 stop:18214 length:342 start_codon:yes stop_codon:yes gene_type:complete